jgi:nucleoid-associated protein YgaU
MFLKNSRYFGLKTVTGKDRSGRPVQAVALRRLPATPGIELQVQDKDQLDVLAERRYKDGTRYWHIADANSELEANELVRVTGRRIQVPEK